MTSRFYIVWLEYFLGTVQYCAFLETLKFQIANHFSYNFTNYYEWVKPYKWNILCDKQQEEPLQISASGSPGNLTCWNI